MIFEGTDIYCMQYDYDTNGRKIRQVIKAGENVPDTSAYYVTTFNYDTRDMLTEEKYLRWDAENSNWKVMYWARYKYDTAGNMVARDVEQIYGGDVKSYQDTMYYARGYQLVLLIRVVTIDEDTVQYTMMYDANGNLTSINPDGLFTDSYYDIPMMEFQYDLKNRLTKYRFGGSGDWNEIKYDALGRVRERIDLTPTTTKYYYDGRQLIQQLNDSNGAEFDYLRGPTGLDRQWDETNETKRFYIKDNLGTVWAMVNPSDLSVKRYNYNAWGEHIDASDTDFPADINYMRYIGCRVEAFGNGIETQRDALYHLDHRHYLPLLGRLVQQDPLTIFHLVDPLTIPRITQNPYSYCDNSPSNLSDSTGLWGNCCFENGSKWRTFKIGESEFPILFDSQAEIYIGRATEAGWELIQDICYYRCSVEDIFYKCVIKSNPSKACPGYSEGACYDFWDIWLGKQPAFFFAWEGGGLIPLHDHPWEYVIDVLSLLVGKI